MHKQVEEKFKDADDVVFFHVQTVFEGASTNTPENGRKVTKAAGIEVPVGFDARVDGARISGIMLRYGTGGTPWTIVIDKKGEVAFSNFTPASADALAKIIEKKRKGR